MLNFFDRKSKDMTLHNVTAVGPEKTGVETLGLHELKKKNVELLDEKSKAIYNRY